ncbi:MAG: YdeI family protein [Nitrospinota bacterium]
MRKNHAKAKEIWLVYFKKNSGKPGINYADSVEEALCFGWIDGLKKSIDEQRYSYRFTPRKAGSKWSPLNIRLAERMIDEEKMTQAGLLAFDKRITYDEEILKAKDAKQIPLTSEIENALRANKKAWENFNSLAPGYKKQYIGWISNAKKQETMKRRVKEAIRLLAGNKKLGMK